MNRGSLGWFAALAPVISQGVQAYVARKDAKKAAARSQPTMVVHPKQTAAPAPPPAPTTAPSGGGGGGAPQVFTRTAEGHIVPYPAGGLPAPTQRASAIDEKTILIAGAFVVVLAVIVTMNRPRGRR